MINTFGQYLALHIATQLNDMKHKGFYFKLAKRYDTDDLLFILALTLDIVKKSKKPVQNKGALFTKLFFEYIDKNKVQQL